jgi:hypothetical protein
MNIDGCRCDERLNDKTEGVKRLTYTEVGTSPGRTCKIRKDLSTGDREECGCGQGGGVYPIYPINNESQDGVDTGWTDTILSESLQVMSLVT